MCSLSTAVVKAIEAGRGHGRYNLSGQDLQEIPAQVYDADIPLPAVKGSKQATGEGEWWGWEEVKKIDASRNRQVARTHDLPVHPLQTCSVDCALRACLRMLIDTTIV